METKLKNMKTLLGELCDTNYYTNVFGVNEMLIDIIVANIEEILQFKHCLMPKIQSMTSDYDSVKLNLDAAKKELMVREQELKTGKKPCDKCPLLEKELVLMKKKQTVNESRIKCIAKILTSKATVIQDSQDNIDDCDMDSDQSSITKAYNLVSQMLGCNENTSGVNDTEEIGKKISPKKIHNKKNILPDKGVYSHSVNKGKFQNNSKDNEEAIENNVLVCSVDVIEQGNCIETCLSPSKISAGKPSTGSPVLSKTKSTPIRNLAGSVEETNKKSELNIKELDDPNPENLFCIPSSPKDTKGVKDNVFFQNSIEIGGKRNETSTDFSKKNKSSEDKAKKVADFWQLKGSNVELGSFSRKDGLKLRQTKLSLGCFPKKVDLCDLEEFNGGIRKSQTSTQISNLKVQNSASSGSVKAKSIPQELKLGDHEDFISGIHKSCTSTQNTVCKPVLKALEIGCVLKEEEDVVIDSPAPSKSDYKRKGRRPFDLGRKLSYDVGLGNVESLKVSDQLCDGDQLLPMNDKKEQKAKEPPEVFNSSFDCVTKASTSPKFKYRDDPVRKKSERQKLSGWDCDNCRKYFEAVGGNNMSEEERKMIMNRCSRHRNKHPVQPKTPPGFWDAEFPSTPECEHLNLTYTDVLPLSKKQKR